MGKTRLIFQSLGRLLARAVGHSLVTMNPMITGSGFVTQPPLDDLPQASQSTLLLQKLKEMAEVQQQLDRKKEEFRSRMQRCQEKEVALASRQEDIKEQVQKFDKFLKDNDAKRVRADRKVQEERKAAEQKEREKQELIQFLQREEQKRQALKAEVEKNSKYQRFLDSVVEDPAMAEYFEGIENITMRYETLSAAHADLSGRVLHGQKNFETENAEVHSYIKQRTNDMLVYNSEIASKQTEVDKMRFEIQGRDASLSAQFNKTKESTRGLGEVKMAIENIYGRCAKARRPGQLHDHMSYLEAICERVCDLQCIVKEVGTAGFQASQSNINGSYALPQRLREGAAGSADDPAAAKTTANAGASSPTQSTGGKPKGSGTLTLNNSSSAGASATSVNGGLTKTPATLN